MANKSPYQTTFEPEHTIQPIYTGGSVALDQDGRILATTLGEDALLTDLKTGKQLAKIEGVWTSNCLMRDHANAMLGRRSHLHTDLYFYNYPSSAHSANSWQ